MHELKTPLTPLLSLSDLLVAQLGEGTWAEAARNINRGATRLSKRIDELMDLSKGEMGLLEIESQRLDLLKLLEETATYMEPNIIRKGQILIRDIPQPLPPVSGDEDRLFQVIINLLDNASKFTPRKGKITLSAKTTERGVTVEVQNSGRCLTEEQKRVIFQPYRCLYDHKGHGEGLGLGLALAQILIKLHGGQIWVTSDERKGNVFGFSLPISTVSNIRSKG